MRKVIIVGASDGLGRAIADLCTNQHITVVNISRTPCNISGVINISCDLTSKDNIDEAIRIIKDKHSDFDAIVNCAAIVGMEKINEITYEKLLRAYEVNTIGPLYFISSLYDEIVNNGADILNIGTTSSAPQKPGFKDQLAYTTTKYALRGGSYNLSLELKATQSRVIHINLGGMNTKMHEKDYGAKIEDPSIWMKPDDIAGIVLYLLNLPKQIEISEITINRKGRRLS